MLVLRPLNCYTDFLIGMLTKNKPFLSSWIVFCQGNAILSLACYTDGQGMFNSIDNGITCSKKGRRLQQSPSALGLLV